MNEKYNHKAFLELSNLVREQNVRLDEQREKIRRVEDALYKRQDQLEYAVQIKLDYLYNIQGLELKSLAAYRLSCVQDEKELRELGWEYMGRNESSIFMCRKKPESNG